MSLSLGYLGLNMVVNYLNLDPILCAESHLWSSSMVSSLLLVGDPMTDLDTGHCDLILDLKVCLSSGASVKSGKELGPRG